MSAGLGQSRKAVFGRKRHFAVRASQGGGRRAGLFEFPMVQVCRIIGRGIADMVAGADAGLGNI
jgi:hypothetical protein